MEHKRMNEIIKEKGYDFTTDNELGFYKKGIQDAEAEQQLKILNIPVVMKSACGSLHHFTDIAQLGRCEECLKTRKP